MAVVALLASSASRVKETVSFKTRISADTVTVSCTAKPCCGSVTAATGAKSHQPWLFFFPENRCQESRATVLASDDGCTSAKR